MVTPDSPPTTTTTNETPGNMTAAYEVMNRRKLVEAVQAHNDRVQVIRSYSRKSKDDLLKELRRVYPLKVIDEED